MARHHWVRDGEHIDLGGRELEVIFTPGHTPDSLSLLDRRRGLLFTGDTFYPGPIYLFTPETDFAAYAQSVARLAQLVAHIRLLLPGHNVPIAAPESLARLNDSVKSVQLGAARFVVTEGRRDYRFEGFSLFSQKNREPSEPLLALLWSIGWQLLSEARNYQGDVYAPSSSSYYPVVVWQFWGRAAEGVPN